MSALEVTDVCSGAGMAMEGYVQAGLVPRVGIDHEPQPDYPYPFVQMDARRLWKWLEFMRSDGLHHYSWPCQRDTRAQHLRDAQGGRSKYPDLLTPGLVFLRRHRADLPWVVENVENRGKREDVGMRLKMKPREGEQLLMLCGSMFGLPIKRHRLFLINGFTVPQPACRHDQVFEKDPVTGKPRPWGVYHVASDSVPKGGRTARDAEHARELFGMTRSLPWDKIKEGFPPAYTRYIGAHYHTKAARA